LRVGTGVGTGVGLGVGARVGATVGPAVGVAEGAAVGAAIGVAVGLEAAVRQKMGNVVRFVWFDTLHPCDFIVTDEITYSALASALGSELPSAQGL
jgi:hypothetical protein